MKTRETTPGKTYSVHTMKGCTIIEPDGWQKTIEAPDGYFDAHFGSVVIEGDDEASIKQLFKLAPYQKLRLLGVVGGNAVSLPAGYKRLEYLESTGTQYMVLTAEMQMPLVATIDCTLSIKSVDNKTSNDMYYGYKYNPNKVLFCSNGGSLSLCGGVQSWFVAGHSVPLDRKRHLSVMKRRNFEEQTELVVDGTKIEPRQNDNLAGTWAPGVPYLFALNENDKPSSFCAAKIWGFSYKHGDAIDCNLIPCLDKTGAPCMFDLVSRKPFYNRGTGDFIYPTESTTYALRRVLPDWGKLTEHGLRRLYHAPEGYTGELYDYALENGYKPIIEPEMPEEGYWSPHWTETADEIVLEWVETEPPMDELLTETE